MSAKGAVIDAASNPVEIDAYSYECIKENHLFAMGRFDFDSLLILTLIDSLLVVPNSLGENKWWAFLDNFFPRLSFAFSFLRSAGW